MITITKNTLDSTIIITTYDKDTETDDSIKLATVLTELDTLIALANGDAKLSLQIARALVELYGAS